MDANLRIGISRLTILELEYWKNDPREQQKQQQREQQQKQQQQQLQQQKQKIQQIHQQIQQIQQQIQQQEQEQKQQQQQEQEQKQQQQQKPKKGKAKEKLAYLSLGELLTIKNDKHHWLMPQLPDPMLESFSSVAGRGFADSLIRKEISPYPDSFILTSDLMNAFAANAENFNVIYFSRISQMKSSSEIVERLASLVYNVSIEIEQCRIDLDGYKKFDVTGMWEGKTPDIWKNNTIQIEYR
jgi:flagellar biosynthesis GTPase FlhF